jgi:hypothetical protein
VAKGGDIGGGSAFAEHLDDRIARDEVDEEKDDADDDPENRKGDEDAAEGAGHAVAFPLSDSI